ncbi:somatic embryogenesis receptor kinase 4 [Rosa rugosa]|uniref:somatic embryogenesis receptor kinase 4 n=1 Tax=Rosa rugosa TaxID=74645 RepID=UPI002B416EA0|nr:somatic embryogenesis receptor kinase 4 [Rosa rugosa]
MGSIRFLIALFVVLGVFTPPPRVCGNAELGALLQLKASLDPEGKYLSSWTEHGDPCSGTFEGVACNEKSKVANVSLQGKGLSGRLSPAVAELRCLSGLYLHYNNLSGKIPKEIGALTGLTDLYLNVNNLSGGIPREIGNMTSLQVLQLCCNQLNGSIPTQMGSLKRLSVLALQYNRISGQIPASLGNLGMLKRLDLGFNKFFGTIPAKLASIPSLELLDIRNNSLSGVVSPAFKRLNEGFKSANNSGLCGVGFSTLRICTSFDTDRVNDDGLPLGPNLNKTVVTAPPNANPESVDINTHCNQNNCKKSTKFPQAAVIAGVIALIVTLAGGVFLALVRNRRKKQKIGNTCDPSDGQLSTDQAKEFYRRSPSPLVSLEYSNAWDPLADGQNGLGFSFSQEYLKSYWFNMEDVESATQYFSEVNLLGKSKFSSVYKGVLRDGSLVAVKSINVTSCKSEEAEFVKGLHLVFSLTHENLVKLKGFCCSRGRGECFLIYDFAPNGNLSQYLDVIDGKNQVLDWSKRVSVLNGIAKGIGYLHGSEENKPAMIHQNISVEKVLLDKQFKPLISDSGLPKLLADDIVFSTLKTSAAMGYLAPEYITTGRFTEKSDVYAFGVIVLQVISGNLQLNTSMRLAAESCRYEEFVDTNLKGQFSEPEAAALGKLGLVCTHEHPDQRPTMQTVIQELSNLTAS